MGGSTPPPFPIRWEYSALSPPTSKYTMHVYLVLPGQMRQMSMAPPFSALQYWYVKWKRPCNKNDIHVWTSWWNKPEYFESTLAQAWRIIIWKRIYHNVFMYLQHIHWRTISVPETVEVAVESVLCGSVHPIVQRVTELAGHTREEADTSFLLNINQIFRYVMSSSYRASNRINNRVVRKMGHSTVPRYFPFFVRRGVQTTLRYLEG